MRQTGLQNTAYASNTEDNDYILKPIDFKRLRVNRYKKL